MNKLIEIYNDDPLIITNNKAFDLNVYKEDVIELLELVAPKKLQKIKEQPHFGKEVNWKYK